MKNFETIVTNTHPDLEKVCSAKSRPVINAITEDRNNYRVNTPRVISKLEKSISEALDNLKLEDTEENRDRISNQILKRAIEAIAIDQAMGKISSFSNLEDTYLDILEGEILNRPDIKDLVSDFSDLIKLIDEVDEKEILDKDSRSRLIDKLSSELF
ncbi:MAG: hypothetical protein ACOXZ1_02040 [Patescibacteria group bacterium]